SCGRRCSGAGGRNRGDVAFGVSEEPVAALRVAEPVVAARVAGAAALGLAGRHRQAADRVLRGRGRRPGPRVRGSGGGACDPAGPVRVGEPVVGARVAVPYRRLFRAGGGRGWGGAGGGRRVEVAVGVGEEPVAALRVAEPVVAARVAGAAALGLAGG